MNNANCCKDCNETLILHADGSVACSCQVLDAESYEISPSWSLTKEELFQARMNELSYALVSASPREALYGLERG